MISEALHLSVELNKLEHKIRNVALTELVTYPPADFLETRRLIESAKPTRLLGEPTDEVQQRETLQLEHKPEPKKVSSEVVVSFNEVLRLAKSGQQPWWTDETKKSTDRHIQRVQEYYEKHIKVRGNIDIL